MDVVVEEEVAGAEMLTCKIEVEMGSQGSLQDGMGEETGETMEIETA